jgi:hypothetical protein
MSFVPNESVIAWYRRGKSLPVFHPAAGAVSDQFDEVDMVFLDADDATVVLADVVADVNAMDHAIRVPEQAFHALGRPERSRHLQTVQRERFERFARPVLVRMRPAAVGLVLFFETQSERIAQVLVLVQEHLEGLDDGQRRQRRALFRLLACDPLLRRLALAAAGQGNQRKGTRHAQRECDHPAHLIPPSPSV